MRGWLDTIRMPGGRVRLKHPVYFVRHGETDWNVERRYQGHSDIPLNDTGREQAARNGRALREALAASGAGSSRIAYFSSPLSRATETLEIMRETMGLSRKRYALDDRLIEIDLGAWNGRTYDEIAAADPGVHERRAREKWRFAAPGGESYADAALRVRDFLIGLDRVSVIVGHGAAGRILRGYLTGMRPKRVPHIASPQDVVFYIERGRESRL